jgi:hypothetical protein
LEKTSDPKTINLNSPNPNLESTINYHQSNICKLHLAIYIRLRRKDAWLYSSIIIYICIP